MKGMWYYPAQDCISFVIKLILSIMYLALWVSIEMEFLAECELEDLIKLYDVNVLGNMSVMGSEIHRRR